MNKLGLVVVLALVGACGDNDKSASDAATDAPNPAIARGQYIVNVLGACTFCHTKLLNNGMRDLDNLFAGVDCFADIDSPTFMDDGGTFGCISSRNLTNHATGLANATDSQIKDAFQNGNRTDDKKIVPIMPWWLFHNMTDEDADAVVAYLRTVPGRDHLVKPNQAPFTAYNEGSVTTLPPFFTTPIVPLTDAEIPMPIVASESALRGRYLATKVGLCIDCHSVTASPFSLEFVKTKYFGGGRVFSQEQLGLFDPTFQTFPPAIAARNLTTHATGLGGWTKEQIKAAIAEGKDRDGNQVCAATHGGLVSGYAALEPQDLDDIAEYVMQLPPVDNDIALSNCGLPPMAMGNNPPAPEALADCNNGNDDDGDLVPDDGCFRACTNCAGPLVP